MRDVTWRDVTCYSVPSFFSFQSVGYPFDIIKTRIQATSAAATTSAKSSSSGAAVLGVYETGLQLIREANGSVLRGLYRGFGLKLVRSIPASMIGFFAYEFVSDSIQSGGGGTQ